MPEYETYIEFSRKEKNRQQLNAFEKFCRHDAILRKAFRRVEGRRFIFAFPTERQRDEFLTEMAEMLEKRRKLTVRV